MIFIRCFCWIVKCKLVLLYFIRDIKIKLSDQLNLLGLNEIMFLKKKKNCVHK